MKYRKYCIYTDGFKDLEQLFFKDIYNSDNVKIISKNTCFKNKLLLKFFRFHFSYRISQYITLPFQRIWYKYIDCYSHENPNTDIIYIFQSSWYYPKFYKYLRRKHKNAKIVLYFSDTIKSKQKVIKQFNIIDAKKSTDMIYSYNPKDVRDYSIRYLPICYSKSTDINIDFADTEYDVVFIGAARNRIKKIEECYYFLKRNNAKVFFYIVNSDTDGYSLEDYIVSNKILSMNEYLSYTLKSRCILEIVDPETEGYTLRFWDAIMYNRYLITTNRNVCESPFYKTGNIIIYDKAINGIDIKKFFNRPEYNYNGDNSSKKFIEKITNDLYIDDRHL